MTRTQHYILNELKIIERECQELGISASEWVERYAKGYRRRYDRSNKPLTLTLSSEGRGLG